MQKRDGALVLLIAEDGRFLLQRRDNKPGIEQPGKLSLFGGGRENEETFLDCAVRELYEEINYSVSAERFEYLGCHQEEGVEGRLIIAKLFLVRSVHAELLRVTEGSLQIVAPDEIDLAHGELAPVARAAIKLYREKDGQ